MKKIAILGGGLGALSTAYQLTNKKNWQDEYEITIYQMGWRLGGKGSSGRNLSMGSRVEEHGLHVFFDFYDNVLHMVKTAYEEGSEPGDCLSSWVDALIPMREVLLMEKIKNKWIPWKLRIPEKVVKRKEFESLSINEYLMRACDMIELWTFNIIEHHIDFVKVPHAKNIIFDLVSRLSEFKHQLKEQADANRAEASQWKELQLLISSLQKPLQEATDKLKVELDKEDVGLNRLFVLLDYINSVTIGLMQDNVLANGLESLDSYDWIEWLKRHGVHELTAKSILVRSVYDPVFAFADGEMSSPSLSASVAMRGLFKLFLDYREFLFWKLKGGMGDIVFTPLYKALKKRGVKFKFFHRTVELKLDESKTKIQKILIDKQADLKADDYNPFVRINGVDAWPNQPLYQQLADQTKKINFEEEQPEHSHQIISLEHKTDFDFVVLGISIGGLKPICKELTSQSVHWHHMIKNVATVRTQALQLWLNVDLKTAGWPTNPPLLNGFDELTTWGDMSHGLMLETWEENKQPKTLAYFCGPLSENASLSDKEIKARAKSWCQDNLRGIFPDLFDKETGNLDDKFFCGSFENQYFRANATHSERYTLSLPGTTQYRLSPLHAHFENLTIAGDWTENLYNVSCAEAAVLSGFTAAKFLLQEIEKEKNLAQVYYQKIDISNLLYRTSRTFAITIPLLPDPLKQTITLAYLLFRIIDTLEDGNLWSNDKKIAALENFHQLCQTINLDQLSKLTQSWIKEPPTDNEDDLELLKYTPEVFAVFQSCQQEHQSAVLHALQFMNREMSHFIQNSGDAASIRIQSLTELKRYCYAVAGIIGEMLTALFCLEDSSLHHEASSLMQMAKAFGEGLQLTNIIKDIEADALEKRTFVPPDVTKQELIELASENLDKACLYVRKLYDLKANSGIVESCALPVLLAQESLYAIKDSKRRKLSRPEVIKIFINLRESMQKGMFPKALEV